MFAQSPAWFLYSIAYGLLLSAVLSAMAVAISYINPEIMLRSYPPDVRARYGQAKTNTSRRRALAGLLIIGVIALAVAAAVDHISRLTGAALGFVELLAVIFVMFMTFNVIDLVVIDWLIFVTWQPKFVVLRGTEGLAGYKDYAFHFHGFLRGVVICAVLSVAVAGAITVAVDGNVFSRNNEPEFRLLSALVFVAFTVLRGLYFRQLGRRGEDLEQSRQDREGKVVLALRKIFGAPGLVGLLVYWFAPAWMAWSAMPMPEWLRWLGGAAGLTVLPLLAWIHHSLGTNWSDTLHVMPDHYLVTRGPYRWVRHPMYSVFVLFAISLFLITANWFIGLMWLGGTLVVVISRVPVEEKMLLEKFGDEYRQFMSRTGRFLPKVF